MLYLLIKAEGNYADEFDVEGFSLLKGDLANNALTLLEQLELVPRTVELNFGTNESVYMQDIHFDITELTKEQYEAIESTIGDSYGLLSVDCALELIEAYSNIK